jgi:hypothetical protein
MSRTRHAVEKPPKLGPTPYTADKPSSDTNGELGPAAPGRSVQVWTVLVVRSKTLNPAGLWYPTYLAFLLILGGACTF